MLGILQNQLRYIPQCFLTTIRPLMTQTKQLYLISIFTPVISKHTPNCLWHWFHQHLRRQNLLSLNPTKAIGIDSICPAVLKNCAYVLTKYLYYLFSLVVSYCCLPSEWKIHCIIPIVKAGNKILVSYYRPISLLCIVSKILFIVKLLLSFVIAFLPHSLDLWKATPPYNIFLSSSKIFMNMKLKRMWIIPQQQIPMWP